MLRYRFPFGGIKKATPDNSPQPPGAMTILDRYILKSFFFNLILWGICIIGIFIVFDLFTNLDSLLQVGKEAGNVPKTLAIYYLFKAIPIGMMLSSVLGLISALITTSMLIRNNELVPIQAAGVSTIRVVSPLIGGVVFVALAAFVLREAVLPHFLDEMVMDARQLVSDQGLMVNATFDSQTMVTIAGERIFRSEKRISQPTFRLHKPLVKRSTILRAENAVYQPGTKDRAPGFLLDGLHDSLDVFDNLPLELGGLVVLQTHRDDPQRIKEGQCFITSYVPFDYMASSDAWRQYASTWSMIHAARSKSLDVGDRIHTTIHRRLIQPLLDITILFLGLPIILSCGDRNVVFKSMGICGVLVTAFMVLCQSCLYLGTNGNMPVLGAWLPMMIFVPIAVNQFLKLRDQ